MSAIKLDNAQNVTLENLRIEDSGVGIEASNSTIHASDVSFRNVGQAWKINGNSTAGITRSKVTGARKPDPAVGASKGWTPSNAPALPILCGTCGSISASSHHQLRGRFFDLWDNEEPCPKCAHPAKLSEGTFNLARDTVEVLKAPQLTHDMLAALYGIAVKLAGNEITPAEAFKEVEQTSPAAANAIKKAVRTGVILSAALIAFFDLMNGYHDFIQNFGIDPVAVSADYILEHILPRIDTPPLQEGMKEDAPSTLHHESANPSESETIPKTVSSELLSDDEFRA